MNSSCNWVATSCSHSVAFQPIEPSTLCVTLQKLFTQCVVVMNESMLLAMTQISRLCLFWPHYL